MKNYNGSFIETLIAIGIVALIIAMFIPVFLQVKERQKQTRDMFHMKQQYQEQIEQEYQDWKNDLEKIVKEK